MIKKYDSSFFFKAYNRLYLGSWEIFLKEKCMSVTHQFFLSKGKIIKCDFVTFPYSHNMCRSVGRESFWRIFSLHARDLNVMRFYK